MANPSERGTRCRVIYGLFAEAFLELASSTGLIPLCAFQCNLDSCSPSIYIIVSTKTTFSNPNLHFLHICCTGQMIVWEFHYLFLTFTSKLAVVFPRWLVSANDTLNILVFIKSTVGAATLRRVGLRARRGGLLKFTRRRHEGRDILGLGWCHRSGTRTWT